MEDFDSVVVSTARPEKIAEFKADQLRSCGPDPEQKKNGAQPLSVSIEPLPV